MIKRQKPTVYRKRGTPLTRHNFALTKDDVRKLEYIRTAYENGRNFSVSTSIILGIALDALYQEVCRGRLRSHRDLYISD